MPATGRAAAFRPGGRAAAGASRPRPKRRAGARSARCGPPPWATAPVRVDGRVTRGGARRPRPAAGVGGPRAGAVARRRAGGAAGGRHRAGVAGGVPAGPASAARSRRRGPPLRRRATSRRARREARRRRSGVGGARLQSHGARGGRARSRAGRRRPRAPAAAGRRHARTAHAAHRDPRLRRDADAASLRAGHRRRGGTPCTSSTSKRSGSSVSSTTCSIWRGSMRAARRSSSAPVPVARLFTRVVERHGPAAAAAGVTLETSTSAPGADTVAATSDGSNRCCRTSPPTRCATSSGGRSRLARGRARRRRRRVPRARHRRRHRRRASAARLRPLLQGRRRPQPTAAGTGLGLSIVKAIVERHGGTCARHEHAGRGDHASTVRLPR